VIIKTLQSMYNKKDLTYLTEKLWQSSEFIFDYASRKRKYSLPWKKSYRL